MIRWILAIGMIAMLAGGTSASVQLVAWAGMLAARTAEQGWTAAAETTFDGNHPCGMCQVAKSLKQAESGGRQQPPDKGDPPPVGKAVKKFDTPLARLVAPDGSPSVFDVIATAPPLALGRPFSPTPEPPPPRS